MAFDRISPFCAPLKESFKKKTLIPCMEEVAEMLNKTGIIHIFSLFILKFKLHFNSNNLSNFIYAILLDVNIR